MRETTILNCYQSTGLLVAGALLGLALGLIAFFSMATPVSNLPAYLSLPIYLGGGQITGLTIVLLLMIGLFFAKDDC